MSDSFFREVFEHLPTLHGNRIQWPQVLRFMIEQEVETVGKSGTPYVKAVFIDRDEHCHKNVNNRNQRSERVAAQRLYREAKDSGNQCLRLEGDDVLLISYNVPNQGKRTGRCADLLGLRLDGSLIVFECKMRGNGESPLSALFQGLDYLSHLLIPKNMANLQTGFDAWRQKRNTSKTMPLVFSNATIKPTGRHSVLVLAEEAYYGRHKLAAGGWSHDWHLLSDRHWSKPILDVRLDFATTDFNAPVASLLTLPTK